VAVLVFRALPVDQSRLHLRVPADPEALPSLRHALRRWLESGGVGGEAAYEILVAAGEAIANAVEHAYGPGDGVVDIGAVHSDGEVSLTVRDEGRWRPARGVHRGRGSP
jgi:anti-sigma regulatory factor (Ser/Thr protein kinase)